MSEITKEELMAMIDVQSKTATAMESIANSIRQLSETNKDILDEQRLFIKQCVEGRTSCQSTICTKFKEAVESAVKPAIEIKDVIGKVRDDTFWLKIILGSATLIGLLAGILFKAFHH